MNRSPLRHRGPLHHELYLHLLKALGGLMEAAGLWLPARGATSLSIFTLEERVRRPRLVLWPRGLLLPRASQSDGAGAVTSRSKGTAPGVPAVP